jgi:GNAT superfamily N-acetyltransferase
MPPPLRLIRAASPKDIPILQQIHAAAIQEGCRNDYTPNQLQAWVGQLTPTFYQNHLLGGLFYVTVEGEEIQGFGKLDLVNAEIPFLFTHPHLFGQGIGKSLLQKLETLAVKQGIESLRLLATLNAIPFYEKQGYLTVIPCAIEMAPHLNLPAYLMVKTLEQFSEEERT